MGCIAAHPHCETKLAMAGEFGREEATMPALIEMPEAEVLEQAAPGEPGIHAPLAVEAVPFPAPVAGHPLFSDSLLESSSSERRRRSLAATLSVIFQCMVVGALLIVPLMFTEALPTRLLLTYLVAAPPPPPPPPPAAAVPASRIVQTDMLNNGQLRVPTRIPRKVEMLREEEAPPPAMGGVIGGIPGGIPGGQLGGVIGGIISSTPSPVAKARLEPVKPIRISQGITQGLLVSKIEPVYPKIALQARVTGVVLLKAVISKEGQIKELQATSGHPLLVPAAIDAVKLWRYRPYLLNGEPVEVETIITVTFQIAG
jgi:periplasmic protein TonB